MPSHWACPFIPPTTKLHSLKLELLSIACVIILILSLGQACGLVYLRQTVCTNHSNMTINIVPFPPSDCLAITVKIKTNMEYTVPHNKRGYLLETTVKIELFTLESSDRKRLCSHNGSNSLQLSGNTYLRNPRQKRFLRNELQTVRKSHTRSGDLERVGATLPPGQKSL